MTRSLVLVALAALAAATTATGCFDIKRPPPPKTGSSISGTIHVAGATGQSASNKNAVVQERVDVCLADGARGAGNGAGIDVAAAGAHGREGDGNGGGGGVVGGAGGHSKEPLHWKAGDVLVQFEPKAYDRASLAPAMRTMLRAAELHARAEVVRCSFERYCLVRLYDKVSGKLLDENATHEAQQALEKNRAAKVTVVAKNLEKHGFFVPNDPLFSFQWHYDMIHMRAAWDVQKGDDSVIVAVVDSGAVTAQTDLENRWLRDGQNRIVGTDMVDAGDGDLDVFNGRDTDPEDPGDNLFGSGAHSWHGTHIAGTIGAETNNGEGVAGITQRGKLMPVRVLGNHLSGFDSDIMDGILWALGQHVDGTPDNPSRAKLVNLSLGGPSDAQSQEFWNTNVTAILQLSSKPILVAAAGNSDEDAGNIVPANVPGMITVGAVNISKTRASYSNFGNTVDIMAPGGDEGTDLNGDGQPDAILSTINPDFDWRDGTSMATPHVTGVAALLVAGNPTLDQSSVEALLKQSADATGRCNEGCGAGLLDAVAALLANGGTAQPEALMSTDVSGVFFPTGLQSITINALNLGDSAFNFTATIEGAQAELFHVSPSSGSVPSASSPNPRVPLTITLARGTFQAGSANLKLATTDASINPPQEISVDLNFNDDPNRNPTQIQEVQVAAFQAKADGSLESVAKVTATRDDGFAYTLDGLKGGDYQVFAIGDDNLDGIFEANVESFGAYPTRDAPEFIHLDDDQAASNVDFGIDAAFITDIVGGVGAPCNADNDCNFQPDAQCVVSFTGGYCSRLCDDGQCGQNGSCESLKCDDNGTQVDCNICLVRCASDAQCRFGDGYKCDLGECIPANLPP